MRYIASFATPIALALLLSCSSGSTTHTTEQPKTPVKHGLTVFLSSEIKGTTEPCGCTADPLGDLARTAGLIADARAEGPVLVFDGGSTLYSQIKITPSALPQEQLKAALIEKTFKGTIHVDAMALGPYDLAEGVGKVRPPRHAVNLAPDSALSIEAPKVIEQGGMKLGVFGVVSPSAMQGLGVQLTPAAPAAAAAIADLKKQGAQVIIALAHMTKAEARTLAKSTPGMDFVLISQNLPDKPTEVRPEPIHVGNTWLFRPADRGQVISRLRLTRRGAGPFVDAIGEARATVEIERITAEVLTMQADVEKWQADPSADKAFVASKQKELETLVARKTELQHSPLQAPAKGNYFTLAQIRISKDLNCQAEIVKAKQEYDKASGAANVKAGAGVMPEKPAEGQASYVGMDECSDCHQSAVDYWKNTHHARAWSTLEKVGKQFDYDCIGCHVTGFDLPGGSNIGHNDSLRNVQCEQCHGPGSLHVDAEAADFKTTITRVPSESVCKGCHTQDHSDTFAFDAYLRDITGEGHGADRRKALGDGETGLQLRSAALKKAGQRIGDNCPK